MSNTLVDTSSLNGNYLSTTKVWTPFGSPEDFNQMPEARKSKILFLDQISTEKVYEAVSSADLLCGDDGWGNTPFSAGCFHSVEEYRIREYDDLKKWMCNLGIPNANNLFILPTFGTADEPALYSNWEMAVEYSNEIFCRDNMIVVSVEADWCLHYHHDGVIKFAKQPRENKNVR